MSKQRVSYFEDEKFIPLNNLSFKIKQISSSTESVLMLTTDFQVFLKGEIGEYNYNDFTKLPFKNIKYIASGELFNLLIDDLNNVFICGELENTKYNSFTKFDKIKDDIKFIVSGADVVIVTKTNKLIICGLLQPFNGTEFTKVDGLSILENTPKNIEIKDLQIGYYHSVLLDNLGNVYGSGENKNGQLGNTDETTLKEYTKLNIPFKVKKIATYTEGTLLLSYNNELYGSGLNHNHQLGMTGSFKDFTKIILNENLIIKKLYHSEQNYNIILTNDGFYGCGNKKFGKNAVEFIKLNYERKL
ncbi:hypothetical protein ABK040_000957 [Willaertia magna]